MLSGIYHFMHILVMCTFDPFQGLYCQAILHVCFHGDQVIEDFVVSECVPAQCCQLSMPAKYKQCINI